MSTLHYNSLAEAVGDYELSRGQVKQALQYCAVRQCVADKPAVFCHNCSLDSLRKKSLSWSDLEEVKTESGVMVRGNGLIFFGTIAEFLADWHGEDWWVAAGDLLIDLRNDLLENE